MAIAVGQTSKGRTGAATSIASTGVNTSAAGSTFVIMFVYSSVQTFTSIADNKSNSYTQIGTEQSINGSDKVRAYYCQNGTGGASHTATLTVSGSSGAMTILFLEITGGLTSGILDQSAIRRDTASPFTLAAGLTTTQANECLVTGMIGITSSNPGTHAESGLGSSTIQTGAEETNGASFWTGALATKITSATGTFNPSWTESGNTTDSVVFLATFKESAGGGGIVVNPLSGIGGTVARPLIN